MRGKDRYKSHSDSANRYSSIRKRHLYNQIDLIAQLVEFLRNSFFFTLNQWHLKQGRLLCQFLTKN